MENLLVRIVFLLFICVEICVVLESGVVVIFIICCGVLLLVNKVVIGNIELVF